MDLTAKYVRDPWYTFIRCPAKDEHAAGKEDCSYHHWGQACFRYSSMVIRNESTVVEVRIQDIEAPAKDDTDKQSQERECADY